MVSGLLAPLRRSTLANLWPGGMLHACPAGQAALGWGGKGAAAERTPVHAESRGQMNNETASLIQQAGLVDAGGVREVWFVTIPAASS